MNHFSSKHTGLAFVAVLLLALLICSLTYPADKFKITTPPAPYSSEWYALNYSRREFYVNVEHQQLIVRDSGSWSQTELILPKGKLIGTDRGEWGGQLQFFSSNTANKPIHIASGNIKTIFVYRDSIYYIEGLAHMSLNDGTMCRVDTTGGKFRSVKVLEFDDAPMTCTVFGDSIYLATYQNFYLIHGYDVVKCFDHQFWASLYPTSIAVSNPQNVYMGMRSGYIQMDLSKRDYRFFKYTE